MARDASTPENTVSAVVIPGSAARRARVTYAAVMSGVPVAAIVALGAADVWVAAVLLMFLASMLTPLSILIRRRPQSRAAKLVITPGRVREVGAFGLRLRASEVLGVSTCVHDGGYAVTVRMKRDPAPHTFVVRDEATMQRLVQALGGAHDGTGELCWPLERATYENVIGWGSLISVSFCLGPIALVASLAWPLFAAFPKRNAKSQALTLGEQGIFVSGFLQRAFRYTEIAKASYDADSKSLRLTSTSGATEWVQLAWLGASTSDLIASQVTAAAARARGERTLRDEPLERVRAIKRGASETARAWLTRLSGIAATLGNTDYRSVSVSKDDLWRIAEDSTEAFEDRAAAGRLLIAAVGTGARVRVEEALANAHVSEQRVRVVLEDDLERAADAIDEAREEERKRMALK